MFEVKPFENSDIDLLPDVQPSDWSDLKPIFQFYTASSVCYPIKVVSGDELIGVGASITHSDSAWLGHIIIKDNHRNQGLGKLITQNLIDRIDRNIYSTIFLIATELGKPVYERIGFEKESEYLFFKNVKSIEVGGESRNIAAYNSELKNQIISLDRQISGEDRHFLINSHLGNATVFLVKGIVEGVYFPTFGDGLIIAETKRAGLALMGFRLKSKDYASFPIDNSYALEFMQKNDFKPYKIFQRMKLGKDRKVLLSKIYNRMGGHLG